MRSEHPERGIRKIKILYLEANNTLLLNNVLELGNFGGAMCLDLAYRLKNATLK